MTEFLASAPQDLQNFKLTALNFTGLDRDALHIYAGMALFLCVRLLWRWRGGWIVAWLAALSLALGVEWLDIKAETAGGYLQPQPAHWHDVWNTMFWPTVLLLIGRWLHPKPKAEMTDDPETPPEVSGDLADQTFEKPPPV